ncbi:DUF2946 domain-containing protein [Dyella terrae]|uniref:DUF2946 domain-containing protein n=1 Tax=Dyella terrae TaxID=522259 RepID=UPI003D18B3F7
MTSSVHLAWPHGAKPQRIRILLRSPCDIDCSAEATAACYISSTSPAASAIYVLRRKAHRQIVTWLAWLAIALVVVAPLVSRVMPAHGSMPGMAGMAGMMGSDCPHVVVGGDHPDRPADATDRCGYCVLLDHQSPLAAHVILHLLPALPRAFMSVALHEADVRKTAYEDARPRGPPRFV